MAGDGAGPAGSGRGQRRRKTLRRGGRGSGRGRGPAGGGGLAHPLVDGVRLAQRALGGWNAVGDAPVALAQTPQLAADLLRAKAPAQARPPPSSLWQPARQAATRRPAPGRLAVGPRRPFAGSQGAFLNPLVRHGLRPPLPCEPHLSKVRVCHKLPYVLLPVSLRKNQGPDR